MNELDVHGDQWAVRLRREHAAHVDLVNPHGERHGTHCYQGDTLVCGWPEYHGQARLDPIGEPPIFARGVAQ